MKYTHIIWDFNGTLLDDIDAAVESENVLLRRRGMKEIESRDRYYQMFCFPVRDYYVKLGYDFSKESYEDVAAEWIKVFDELVKGSGLRTGARGLLDYFAERKVRQLVLSACELGMLASQISELEIADYFDDVIGTGDVLASGKSDLALRWREQNPEARPLFIGDTCHDREVAELINADCVLLEGGHNGRALLEASGSPVFADFAELLAAFERGTFNI